MALYNRKEIEALCNRLEARADSLVLSDQPALAADLKTAALLLRMVLVSAEIEGLQISTH